MLSFVLLLDVWNPVFLIWRYSFLTSHVSTRRVGVLYRRALLFIREEWANFVQGLAKDLLANFASEGLIFPNITSQLFRLSYGTLDLVDRLTAKAFPFSSALLHYIDFSCTVRLVGEACLSKSFLLFLFEYSLTFLISLLIFIQTVILKDLDKVAFIFRFEY